MCIQVHQLDAQILNESLLIIKCSARFGLLIQSSGAAFFEVVSQLEQAGTSGRKAIQLQETSLLMMDSKSPKHVERLMINKDTL